MKETKVYLVDFFYDVPLINEEVTLSGRWKTIIINEEYSLEFEDINGNWWRDAMLKVITTEEFINECSNT